MWGHLQDAVPSGPLISVGGVCCFLDKYIENKASDRSSQRGGYPGGTLFIAISVALGVSPRRVVRLSLSKDDKHGHGANWLDTRIISMA